ncbi:MAG: hypothetical protein IT380_17660 [Myxococcales bacterium]|nr:hypothetical protein [Myxococcales bacterium]
MTAPEQRVLRMKLACKDQIQFALEFAPKMKAKVFVPIDDPPPVGAMVTLHIRFADGVVHVKGTAEVLKVVTAPSPGVHARYVSLDPDSFQFPLAKPTLTMHKGSTEQTTSGEVYVPPASATGEFKALPPEQLAGAPPQAVVPLPGVSPGAPSALDALSLPPTSPGVPLPGPKPSAPAAATGSGSVPLPGATSGRAVPPPGSSATPGGAIPLPGSSTAVRGDAPPPGAGATSGGGIPLLGSSAAEVGGGILLPGSSAAVVGGGVALPGSGAAPGGGVPLPGPSGASSGGVPLAASSSAAGAVPRPPFGSASSGPHPSAPTGVATQTGTTPGSLPPARPPEKEGQRPSFFDEVTRPGVPIPTRPPVDEATRPGVPPRPSALSPTEANKASAAPAEETTRPGVPLPAPPKPAEAQKPLPLPRPSAPSPEAGKASAAPLARPSAPGAPGALAKPRPSAPSPANEAVTKPGAPRPSAPAPQPEAVTKPGAPRPSAPRVPDAANPGGSVAPANEPAPAARPSSPPAPRPVTSPPPAAASQKAPSPGPAGPPVATTESSRPDAASPPARVASVLNPPTVAPPPESFELGGEQPVTATRPAAVVGFPSKGTTGTNRARPPPLDPPPAPRAAEPTRVERAPAPSAAAEAPRALEATESYTPPGRSRWPLALTAGLVLTLAGGGAVLFLRPPAASAGPQASDPALLELLQKADARMSAHVYAAPGGDSALDHVRVAVRAAPQHPEVLKRQKALGDLFEAEAKKAEDAGNFADAAVQLTALSLVDPRRPGVQERLAKAEGRVLNQAKP